MRINIHPDGIVSIDHWRRSFTLDPHALACVLANAIGMMALRVTPGESSDLATRRLIASLDEEIERRGWR